VTIGYTLTTKKVAIRKTSTCLPYKRLKTQLPHYRDIFYLQNAIMVLIAITPPTFVNNNTNQKGYYFFCFCWPKTFSKHHNETPMAEPYTSLRSVGVSLGVLRTQDLAEHTRQAAGKSLRVL